MDTHFPVTNEDPELDLVSLEVFVRQMHTAVPSLSEPSVRQR